MKRKPDLAYILRFYDAFLREESMLRVAEALNISTPGIRRQLKSNPDLRLAKEMADKNRKKPGEGLTMAGYILERLSPAARKVWEEIEFWEDNQAKIDALLLGKAKPIRQELFIHALVMNAFDVNEACRMIRISRATLDAWAQEQDFRILLDDLEWHKKNFFEGALLSLVEMGNPGAVLFANRTQNADRGYNEKLEVKHTGSISAGLDIDSLDLDLETRKKILEAIRKKKGQDAIDVEQMKSAQPQSKLIGGPAA